MKKRSHVARDLDAARGIIKAECEKAGLPRPATLDSLRETIDVAPGQPMTPEQVERWSALHRTSVDAFNGPPVADEDDAQSATLPRSYGRWCQIPPPHFNSGSRLRFFPSSGIDSVMVSGRMPTDVHELNCTRLNRVGTRLKLGQASIGPAFVLTRNKTSLRR